MSSTANEMAGLRVAKKELRGLMRHRLLQLSEESLARQSDAATCVLISTPEYQNASRIGIYLSMPTGEISTGAIVRDAFAHHKRVFVPYLYKTHIEDQGKPQSIMEMVSLHSSNDWKGLSRNAWGIPTVDQSSIIGRQRILGDDGSDNQTNELDMIIMPGVAFDTSLSRLGHGRGFYDYFLHRYHASKGGSMPLLVGLGLDVQLLPEPNKVPIDASDWPLDALVVGDSTIIRRENLD